jgi:hypothetical protein
MGANVIDPSDRPAPEGSPDTAPPGLDLRERTLDVAQLLRPEPDIRVTEIFLQPMQLRGAGDRHDPRLLGQQPREGDLRGRRIFLGGYGAEQVHQSLSLPLGEGERYSER